VALVITDSRQADKRFPVEEIIAVMRARPAIARTA
jgi:hypothetical protein